MTRRTKSQKLKEQKQPDAPAPGEKGVDDGYVESPMLCRCAVHRSPDGGGFIAHMPLALGVNLSGPESANVVGAAANLYDKVINQLVDHNALASGECFVVPLDVAISRVLLQAMTLKCDAPAMVKCLLTYRARNFVEARYLHLSRLWERLNDTVRNFREWDMDARMAYAVAIHQVTHELPIARDDMRKANEVMHNAGPVHQSMVPVLAECSRVR